MSLKSLFSRSMDSPDLSHRPMAPPSQRSARRKMTLILLASLLAIVGLGSSAYYFAMRPVTLRIAVGPQNSDDVRVIQSLTQTFARDYNHIRLRPVLTDGAAASAAALGDGKADLAIVRGDLDIPKNALAVASLRKNVAVLWVPTPAKPAAGAKRAKKSAGKAPEELTKISQLAGKRIGVIGRTQANVNLLRVVLGQYGVDAAKVEIIQFSTSEIAEAVRGQKADVFLAAGPINSKITADAIAATSRDGGVPTFLSIDLADAIAQNVPKYEAADIPAGAFGGSPDRPEEEVKTISFSHLFVARRGLSDAVVAAFTRQLFSARLALMNEFPLAAKIETPDTDKDAVLPAHPGAAAYVDGEEKSFLDRYSDYIWFALIGLSAMGSVGAWFATYLRRDERNMNTNLRERLLDMLGIARNSESLSNLDEMQAEADQILRETLTCYEHGAIEQGSLIAFNIALEQFHNAVADRKAVLALELTGPDMAAAAPTGPNQPASPQNWGPRPQVA